MQCEKSRRHCPGPDVRFKFLDERPRLESQIASQSSGPNPDSECEIQVKPPPLRQRRWNSRASDSPGSGFFSTRSARSQGGRLWQTLEFVSSDLLETPPTNEDKRDLVLWRTPSFNPAETLSLSLIETLEYTSRIGHKLQEFCPYLADVPPRIGLNAALDQAVACILAAHAALVRGGLSDIPSESQRYVEALGSLKRNIADPGQSSTPETLCAALILSAYEVSKSPSFSTSLHRKLLSALEGIV